MFYSNDYLTIYLNEEGWCIYVVEDCIIGSTFSYLQQYTTSDILSTLNNAQDKAARTTNAILSVDHEV